jgi:hypothetical protein
MQLQRSLIRVGSVPDIMKNALRVGLDYEAQILNQQRQ